MPTRDARGLSKSATLKVTAMRRGVPPGAGPALSARPPDPALPAPWRWALSAALAVGVPVLLGWAAQRLGPGPHAPVRIELTLQTVGGSGGPAAAGAHRGGIAAPGNAPRDEQAFAISNRSRAPRASPGNAAPALEPALGALDAAHPDAAPAPASPAVRDSRHPLAAAAVPPDSLAAQPVSTRSGRGDSGAANPAGPSVGGLSAGGPSTGGPSAGGTAAPGLGARGLDGARQTVGPEALDSGFGLAVPVRLPYPPAALARGQAGRARIEMEIEPTGRVARVTVLDETAGWGFGDAARQGYVRARFTPPTVQARPVRVLLRKTIEFLP
jgi:TonB family protein